MDFSVKGWFSTFFPEGNNNRDLNNGNSELICIIKSELAKTYWSFDWTWYSFWIKDNLTNSLVLNMTRIKYDTTYFVQLRVPWPKAPVKATSPNSILKQVTMPYIFVISEFCWLYEIYNKIVTPCFDSWAIRQNP